MMHQITLIIAHHHYVFRAVLQNILQSCSGICVLAKVATIDGLLEKIKEMKPDVVLAGLELKGMSDGPAWERLITQCDNTKMIISWCGHDTEKIPEMMRTSPAGFIAWDASPAEYIYAVKQAVKGTPSYCSQTQKLRDRLNGDSIFLKNPGDKWLGLLYCIWLGYSNKEIAMATELTESTVKSYRKKLKSITGFRSVATLEKILGLRDEG